MKARFSHSDLPTEGQTVEMANGIKVKVSKIEHGFDDCVVIKKPDGHSSCMDPDSLRKLANILIKAGDSLSPEGPEPRGVGMSQLDRNFGRYAEINPAMAMSGLLGDPTLSSSQRVLGLQILSNASRQNQGGISTSDIIRGAIGAGLGYAAASATTHVLGSLFGTSVSPTTSRLLTTAGIVGGALRGTGYWR